MSDSGETRSAEWRHSALMISDAAAHAAIEAKDARYDGRFFVGVTSTGIYCRCVCTARTPKPQNRRFFASAAAAEDAGFRPCLLCRPERAPGFAPIDEAERLAGDALRRIEAGALEEAGLAALAQRLGVTDRHLRRVVQRTFGASPIALAQTHRLLTAKRLLHETRLSMAQVAFASGFQSVRRFNAVFQARYRLAPRDLRRAADVSAEGVRLHLPARGAFDADALRASLQSRAVARLERCDSEGYVRSVQVQGVAGWLRIAPDNRGVHITMSETLFPALRRIVADVRSAFDLDADMAAIDAHLDAHPSLAGVRGLRLHGEMDPFEVAVRTVLGQQVTRAAARTLASRAVERFGAPLATPIEGVDRVFPTPQRLADAGLDALAQLGMPGKRAATVQALARAVADGACVLERGAIAAGRDGLARVPGIGPWTREYIALRGLGDPDAFPIGDVILDRARAGQDVESWRPWRAYAAMRLWALSARTPPAPKPKTPTKRRV